MIPLPNKEEFFHLYQNLNKSRQELALYYKVHKGTIDNWCKKFGVKKTKQQICEWASKNGSTHSHEGYYNEKTFSKFPHLKEMDGTFYIVRMYNDTEIFYKVGITRYDAKQRYYGRSLHYKLDIIHEEKMCLYEAFLKEEEYKQSHRHLHYKPKHRFGGHTECYISHPPALQARVATPSVSSSNSCKVSQSSDIGIVGNIASYKSFVISS